MPIRKVKGGYKWGGHGKVYKDRQGAVKQAQAAYANGYKGDAPHKASDGPHPDHSRKGHRYMGMMDTDMDGD